MSMFQIDEHPLSTAQVKSVWSGAKMGLHPEIRVPNGVSDEMSDFPICRICKVNSCVGACGVQVHVSKCFYYRECAQIILSLDKLHDYKYLEPSATRAEQKKHLDKYNLPLIKRLIEIRKNPVCLCMNTYTAIDAASQV